MSETRIFITKRGNEEYVIASSSEIKLYILDLDELDEVSMGRKSAGTLVDEVITDWRHSPETIRGDMEQYIENFIKDNA